MYDFRCAPPLRSAQALLVQQFQSSFAQSLRPLLTRHLREVVDVVPGAIDLLAQAELAGRLQSGAVHYRFELGDSAESRAVLDIDAPLASRMAERLCGGLEEPGVSRPLTSIERSVLGELLARALPLLSESLSCIGSVHPAQLAFAPATDAAWLVAPGSHVAACRFELRWGTTRSELAILLPAAFVARPRTTVTEEDTNSTDRDVVLQHVLASQLPIAVRTSFRLPALEIAALSPGSVLATGHPANGTVGVTVGGQLRFVGILGRERDQVAVRLLRDSTIDDSSPRSNRRNA